MHTFISPVLVKDMQTPPSKRALFIFWSKMTRNVLKRMKKQFSYLCNFFFFTIFMYFYRPKIEKKLSQKMRNVLKWIFELFLILFKICKCFYRTKLRKKCFNRCAMFWNGFLCSWVFFCAIFSFWVMVDFVFYLRSTFRTNS